MRFRARSRVSNEERRLDRAGGSPPNGTGAEKEGGVTNEIEKSKEGAERQSSDRNDGSGFKRGRKECDVKGPKSSFDDARRAQSMRAAGQGISLSGFRHSFRMSVSALWVGGKRGIQAAI